MNNASGQQPILLCQNLRKTFSDGKIELDILKNIQLSVKPAERVAIVGTSGAGKSTLLHILGGLDKATSGKVFIAGRDMTALSDAERSRLRNQTLGFVYQFHHLLPEFTVLENICMPLLIRGDEPKDCQERALSLLDKIGLLNRQSHKLSELSGGERQRTAIARALITKPLCVLADEPTGNLDQKTAERVYAMMLALNQELNTSLIIVTHDMHLASKMDRILTLENGILVQQ